MLTKPSKYAKFHRIFFSFSYCMFVSLFYGCVASGFSNVCFSSSGAKFRQGRRESRLRLSKTVPTCDSRLSITVPRCDSRLSITVPKCDFGLSMTVPRCDFGPGLGTAFFPVQKVPVFPDLLKNVPFFSVFLSFWRLTRPKRTERSFPFF